MKVFLNENKKVKEAIIEITYPYFNRQIQNMVDLIEDKAVQLQGQKGKQIYILESSDVYYIESVDNLSFLYTKTDVYENKEKLYVLNSKLNKKSFVQINKSTLLNMDYLDHVQPLPNYRLEAYLKNGDRLVISRHYMRQVKQYLDIK